MLEEDEREELEKRLKEEFSDYYEISGGKNYRYRHLKSVRKIALKLADDIGKEFDKKVVEIASLYHDIGRSEDIEGGEMDPFEGNEGHAERGAEIVPDFIEEFVSENELEKIQKIIRNHHSEPESLEGKIVQDADDLSNFGVSNLWRQIHYASYYERNLEDSIKYFWNTAIEQYKDKIEGMHFEYTEVNARERLEKQKQAVRRIEKEVEGEDL